MYVNDYTRDMGLEGRQALEILLARAAAAGLVPPVPVIELV
jgi:1,4-dihydroxy-6-naphthoate synthase